MLNLHPQRSTDPEGLHVELDQELHSSNLDYSIRYLSKYDRVDIWVICGGKLSIRRTTG
jgi:hypothetical protein